MADTIVYHYLIDDGCKKYLYINVTNRCTNRCTFCIRTTKEGVGWGINLWLDREPDVDEIIEALKKEDIDNYDSIIFCGYGEPLIRFDDVMAVCRWIKENYDNTIIRINTNGHASAFAGRDVTSEMDGLVDMISISLNAPNAKEYQEVCLSDYGEKGFDYMLDFAGKVNRYVPDVVLSVVDVLPPEKIEECRRIAGRVGCRLRIRKFEG